VRNELLEAAASACNQVQGLQAAIVFGSALTSEHPRDLDLALLWEPSLGVEERWARANIVAAEIEHRIAAFALSVDVKDLRSLPLALQFRVLKEGQRVCVADQHSLVRFQSETVPLALDFLPFQRRALAAAARRLARG
jgi:hypothetical protein